MRSSWLMLARNLRLVLARDLELAALVADLVDQAHVLDGDHRLVGEHRHQLDLLVGERFDAVAGQRNDAEQPAVPHHRHAERTFWMRASARRHVVRIGLGIFGADRLAGRATRPTSVPGPGRIGVLASAC